MANMKIYDKAKGVPKFSAEEYYPKNHNYVLLIPIINEGQRIVKELERASAAGVQDLVDIVICDGGSTDGSTESEKLKNLHVNTLLVKQDAGKQGAQLRMGMHWAIARGYQGILTIDGNNKDSIEDVYKFIEKLESGYDFIQGSRFIKGGCAINTPKIRYLAVRLLHAPLISLTAGKWFTDTTNAFRGYSVRYLTDARVAPFRDIFPGYELLAYLSVRASQLGYKSCEVPVTRKYPNAGKVPTKISFLGGNTNLLKILFANLFGRYNPDEVKK